MESISADFVGWAALFAVLSPLIVSLLKHIGWEWSRGVKQRVAVAMALVGSFVIFGATAGWNTINVYDLDNFWLPLIVGMTGIFSVQYASYKVIWQGTKVLEAVEKFGASSK